MQHVPEMALSAQPETVGRAGTERSSRRSIFLVQLLQAHPAIRTFPSVDRSKFTKGDLKMTPDASSHMEMPPISLHWPSAADARLSAFRVM